MNEQIRETAIGVILGSMIGGLIMLVFDPKLVFFIGPIWWFTAIFVLITFIRSQK